MRPHALLAVAIAIAIVSPTPIRAGQGPRQRTGAPLVLVGDKDYPPLSFLKGDAATGMNVDVARALSSALGRDVRVELTEWSVAQQRVLHGDADGVLSMTISPERAGLYEFTEPFVAHDFGLFVRTDETSIRDVRDLDGKIVGVTSGGLPRQWLQTRTGAKLALIDHYEDGFARLSSGAIDAVAADLQVGAYTLERSGLRNVVRVGPPFAKLEAAIAVAKGNHALAEGIDQAMRRLKQNGDLARIQNRWRPSEMLCISRHRVSWLYWGAGTCLGGILLLAGATVRRPRRAGDEAQRFEAIGRLVASVAHDFNNLIQIIRGHCELALLALEKTSGARENLDEILSASDMARSLTCQLHHVGRKRGVPKTAADLNDIVARMQRMLRHLLGGQIKLVVHCRSEEAYANADVHQIEQLILNLVLNARDAMPSGGTLTLETSLTVLSDAGFLQANGQLTAGEFVTLTVTDTGIGMTPTIRSQIFVPFFTTKAPGKGTGLGLSAVHNIVQEAGGCIVVDSAPGQGTTLTIHLPKDPAPGAAPDA